MPENYKFLTDAIEEELEVLWDEAADAVVQAIKKQKDSFVEGVTINIEEHMDKQPYYLECSECGEELDIESNNIDDNGDYNITVVPHECAFDDGEPAPPNHNEDQEDIDEPLEERMEHPGVDEILQGDRPDPLAFGE